MRQQFGVRFYPSFPRGHENGTSEAIVNSCLVPRPHLFIKAFRVTLSKRPKGTGKTPYRDHAKLICNMRSDRALQNCPIMQFPCIYLCGKFIVKMDNTFVWKHVNTRMTYSLYNYLLYFSLFVIQGISSFQIDGHDFVVSGCEDRSFKILDMKTGMSFLTN